MSISKRKLPIYLSIIAIVVVWLVYLNILHKNEKPDFTTLDPSLYDLSWLTSDSCELGCWNGITPGVTSRAEGFTIINNLPYVNKNNFSESEHAISIPCQLPTENICGSLIYLGDTLRSIYIFPNYKITMNQAVEKIGKPDGYTCYPTDPGATGYMLTVFWIKKQLTLYYTEYKSDNPLIWIRNICSEITADGKLPNDIVISDVQYNPSFEFEDVTDGQPWIGFAEE